MTSMVIINSDPSWNCDFIRQQEAVELYKLLDLGYFYYFLGMANLKMKPLKQILRFVFILQILYPQYSGK